MEKNVQKIKLSDIYVNPKNPRKSYSKEAVNELAETIKASGLIHPARVRPHPDGDGTFELVVGWRRYLAHEFAKLPTMDCIVSNLSDSEVASMMFIENVQREDVDIIEESNAVAFAIEKGLSISELAEQVGKSNSWVASRVVISNMPVDVTDLFKEDKLSLRHLKELSKVFDKAEMIELAKRAVDEALTSNELRLVIENSQHKMETAPWGQEHCSGCEKRSCRQEDLFGVKKDDLCLDGTCWKQKLSDYIENLRKVNEEMGLTVVAENEIQSATYGFGGYTKSPERISKLKEGGVTPHVLIMPDGSSVDAWPVKKEKSASEIAADASIRENKNAIAHERKIQESQNKILIDMVCRSVQKMSHDTFLKLIADAAYSSCYGDDKKVFEDDAEFNNETKLVQFLDSLSVEPSAIKRMLCAWALSTIGTDDVPPKFWKELGVDIKKARTMAEDGL